MAMRLHEAITLRLSTYAAVLLASAACLTGFLILHGPIRAGQGAGPIGRVHTPLSAVITNIAILGLICYCLLELYQAVWQGGGILLTPRHSRRLTLAPGRPASLGSVTLFPKEGLRVVVRLLSDRCDRDCCIGIKLDALDHTNRECCWSELLEMDASVWRRRECVLCREAHRTIQGRLLVWVTNTTTPVTVRVVWQRTLVLAPSAGVGAGGKR